MSPKQKPCSTCGGSGVDPDTDEECARCEGTGWEPEKDTTLWVNPEKETA